MAVKRAPVFVTRLREALVEELGRAGVRAEVVTEKVPGTKLHRITVVAPKFAKLRYAERQNLVWQVAERILGEGERFLITGIDTLTPADLEGEAAA